MLSCALGLAASVGACGSGGDDKLSASSGNTDSATVESIDRAPGVATSSGANGSSDSNGSGEAGNGSSSALGRPRVVILGTSLTAGLGLDPAISYPSLLQEKADSAGYPVNIVNAGLSGETSAGALRRAAWVLDQPSAAVVLEVGANDGLRGVNPDSTYGNLVELVGEIRREQPGARVFLVQMEAPTNLGRDYTTRFHNVYERVARETGITLLPFLLDGVAGNARLNQGDGIHPNPAGSRIVAENMWRGLEQEFRVLGADKGLGAGAVKVPR